MNLRTTEGRKAAIKSINDSCIDLMKKAGLEISNEAICMVSEHCIELGIIERSNPEKRLMALNSEIILNCQSDNIIGCSKECTLAISASIRFTPSNEPLYWKTIHAASILKNWNVASIIINNHCRMYRDLFNEITAIK